MKLGRTTFNVKAFADMSKEDFIAGGYAGTLDPDRAWNRIQLELNKTPEADVQSPVKKSRRGKKGD